mmetsp:Transcript_17334/g.20668  ORF Transcript_17334/g.20668 Transcript_17334/m.20668 type:complete len:276 (+) Transcript_17334:160-987(+)|eukprot:CAMPEP_0198255124 /NCGR_PEP_ID=MMETSP1447-20131203/5336_1 /TAXON_ID=420782 /ORGANISM="Chaetoceros dichaeta, Strain CCMP1751" /LENGTH=275 /DNA_ID=CAMNT_0043941437 /DNA_START=52 /DNA_END=879 /DNA_ORIENTATION=+
MALSPVILFILLSLPSATSFLLLPASSISRLSLTPPTIPTSSTIVNAPVVPVSKLHANNQNTDDDDDDDDANNRKDLNPFAKASWYAVESFGKLFGSSNGSNDDDGTSILSKKNNVQVDLTRAPLSLEETIQRIQLDNDRFYFLSGTVDRLCYAEDCVFSDPFVSFEGRDRFVDNLQNLGSFITEYDVKQLGYDVVQQGDDGDDEMDGPRVDTKVMVKLELNLPWKPILAWPWGVRYDIDPETFLINNHKESWDIDPWEGVKQIFKKPTRKIKKE